MQRPVRIANCSGAVPDPGYQMCKCSLTHGRLQAASVVQWQILTSNSREDNQAKYGPVDVITGDYLAGPRCSTFQVRFKWLTIVQR